jgi:hypothetical protein
MRINWHVLAPGGSDGNEEDFRSSYASERAIKAFFRKKYPALALRANVEPEEDGTWPFTLERYGGDGLQVFAVGSVHLMNERRT